MVLGTITGIFITRILGPQGRGAYAIFQADLELFGMLLNFSLGQAIIFFIASRRIPENIILGSAVVVMAGGTLLLMGILAVLYFFWKDSFIFPGDHNDLFFVFFLVSGFGLNTFNGFVSSIFQGRLLFKIVNLVIIANSVFNLLFFGVLFAVHHISPGSIGLEEVLLLSLAVNFINTGLWIYYFKKKINIRPSFSFSYKEHIQPIGGYSLIAYLTYAVNFINYNLDLWIIEQYKGQAEVGIYSLAVNVGKMFWLVSTPISNVLIPYLSNPDYRSTEVFTFISKINFTAVFIAMLVASCLAPVLFPLVYGEGFARSVQPFYILLPGILFVCMTRMFGSYNQALNKPHYNLLANILGALVTIPLCFFLIPRFGIIGASIATSLSYFTMFVITRYYSLVKLNLPLSNYYILTVSDMSQLSSKLRNLFMPKR